MTRILLSSVLALGLLAFIAAPASAQNRPDPQELGDGLLTLLDRHVDLTPQQATRIRPILRDHADAMVEMIPERRSRMAMMRIRGPMRDLQEQTTRRLMPLLTASQREAFDGYWDEFRRAMRERS
ncbi:MAG: hypothetical protein AAGI52_18725 [Bacteroidota bacterium]